MGRKTPTATQVTQPKPSSSGLKLTVLVLLIFVGPLAAYFLTTQHVHSFLEVRPDRVYLYGIGSAVAVLNFILIGCVVLAFREKPHAS